MTPLQIAGLGLVAGLLCLVILVMGAVTSYARAKADHLGYDAKVGIAERPDQIGRAHV